MNDIETAAIAAANIVASIGEDLEGGWPRQSTRGDEQDCAVCAVAEGEVLDAEGRLICVECDANRARGFS